MTKPIAYTFYPISHCNMCGSDAEHFKVLGKRLNASQGKHPHKKTGITTTIVRCKKCGLIFSNPMPVPLDIQDHYGIPPESYWTEDYLKMDCSAYLTTINMATNAISSEGPRRSLDIGAGVGKFMKACTDSGFETWGCEASEPFYKRAIDVMKIPPDKLFLGRIEEAEYPKDFFDFIELDAVLEHLTNPSAILEKCVKWLKPGGVILVAVPSSNWLISALMDTYYRLTCKDYTSHTSPMHAPFHLYEFGLKSFGLNAPKNGYTIHSYHYNVCQTFMPLIIDRPLKWLMKQRNSGMDLTVLLKKK